MVETRVETDAPVDEPPRAPTATELSCWLRTASAAWVAASALVLEAAVPVVVVEVAGAAYAEGASATRVQREVLVLRNGETAEALHVEVTRIERLGRRSRGRQREKRRHGGRREAHARAPPAYCGPIANQSRQGLRGSASACWKIGALRPMWLKTPSSTTFMPRRRASADRKSVV